MPAARTPHPGAQPGTAPETTPGARVTLVHPRLVPPSLTAHAARLLGGAPRVTERRGPAGHVVDVAAPATSTPSPAQVAAVREQVRGLAIALGVDAAVTTGPLAAGRVGLVVCDADSTFFSGEVIDELAARAGSEAGARVADLTARAMAGELDFAGSLRERVAVLAGLPESVLAEVGDALVPNPGALELLARVHAVGGRLGIVSGGFLPVLEPMTTRLGVDHVGAHHLETRDGRLTGLVEGPVVDRAAKEERLRAWARLGGVELAATCAVGDGANDLDMIAAAGLGVAYAAKPATAQAADAVVTSPRLDVVAEFLGLPTVG